jgi:hypothetical protein
MTVAQVTYDPAVFSTWAFSTSRPRPGERARLYGNCGVSTYEHARSRKEARVAEDYSER